MGDTDRAKPQTLGARLLEPRTAWDRTLRYGLFSWAAIGILGFIFVISRYGLYPIRAILTPIAIALVIVYMLNPLVNRVGRRIHRRGAAVAVVYLSFLVIVGTAGAFVVPLIGRQISGFLNSLPELLSKATRRINEFAAARGWKKPIKSTPTDFLEFVKQNRSTLTGVLGGVRSVAAGVLHVIVNLVLGIVLSVYILIDLPAMKSRIKSAIPRKHQTASAEVAIEIGSSIGSFFRGQLLVALFVGVASAAGLAAVKIPYAVLVGMIAGIFNLVPLIGPFVGAVPAVFLGLLSGDPIRALWAVLVLLTVQQIDNHIISPNVMGRTVKLHPITVMVSLILAGSLVGILGMLVVIPAVATAKIIIARVWRHAGDWDMVPGVIAESVEAVIEAAAEEASTDDAGPTKPKRSTKPRRPSQGSRRAASSARSKASKRPPRARGPRTRTRS